MKNRTITFGFLIFTGACILLSSCRGKAEKPETPSESLAPVAIDSLTPGCFYAKSEDSFYLLPFEDSSFDPSQEILSTDDTLNGRVAPDSNRLLNFVHKDSAIPTLYKNDQLVYVSDGTVSSFTWERFLDYGYSIGLSGLEYTEAEKVLSGNNTIAAMGSSIESAVGSISLPETARLTIDKINGTAITAQFLNDGGIITGMSMNAAANIDFYAGTRHIPVTATADTRYFKSFELYQTDKYALSTDGYAIIEIPSYFKSGYYLINHTGFVKFLNVDCGVDESGIDFDIPYYYEGDDGKTLTFYEWQNKTGVPSVETSKAKVPAEVIDVNEYPERCRIVVDNTQKAIEVTVAYRYISSDAQMEAAKNGKFPRVLLLGPDSSPIVLSEDEGRTNAADNTEAYTYLHASVEGPAAGEWYLLYDNFSHIEKVSGIDISSGNATSFLHNAQEGSISVYYDAAPDPHEFSVSWEKTDRAAIVRILTPDGTIYSRETTPDHVILDEYGKCTFLLPDLQGGEYTVEVKGDKLGRVWVDCQKTVAMETVDTVPETDAKEEP